MKLQMKKSIIVLIGIISVCDLVAQSNKEWIDGKLTWEDFTERAYRQEISELKYNFEYQAGIQEYGNTVVLRNIVYAYINRQQSWINPEYKTEQYLRYNQVIFDIVEVYRRKLQKEADILGNMFNVEGEFLILYDSCTYEIEQFYKESKAGSDLESIIYWEQKISDELVEYPNVSIPKFENRNFGYGMHLGLGLGSFTGSIGKYFTQDIGLTYGFDFAYKKSILYFNGTLTRGKVIKSYMSDENWHETQKIDLALLNVSYGYAFIDNNKIKLAPFAGFGAVELSNRSISNLRFVDGNVVFGINADYKLRTKIKLISSTPVAIFTSSKEKVETSIRARFFVSKVNYAPDLNGYSINLTVELCGFGNKIRLR